jgi:hypothetical protein
MNSAAWNVEDHRLTRRLAGQGVVEGGTIPTCPPRWRSGTKISRTARPRIRNEAHLLGAAHHYAGFPFKSSSSRRS